MQGSSDISSSVRNRLYTSGVYEQHQMRKWLRSPQVLKAFAKGGYSLWSTGALGQRAAREEMYNLTPFAVLKRICTLRWRRRKAEKICDQNEGNILGLRASRSGCDHSSHVLREPLNQALFGHFAGLTQSSQPAQEVVSIITPLYRWHNYKLGNLPRVIQLINLGYLASIWSCDHPTQGPSDIQNDEEGGATQRQALTFDYIAYMSGVGRMCTHHLILAWTFSGEWGRAKSLIFAK